MNFPELTEERRKELVKDIKKIAEDSKLLLDQLEEMEWTKLKLKQKNQEITEDEEQAREKEIQKLTDKYIAEIDEMLEDKEKEIMTV